MFQFALVSPKLLLCVAETFCRSDFSTLPGPCSPCPCPWSTQTCLPEQAATFLGSLWVLLANLLHLVNHNSGHLESLPVYSKLVSPGHWANLCKDLFAPPGATVTPLLASSWIPLSGPVVLLLPFCYSHPCKVSRLVFGKKALQVFYCLLLSLKCGVHKFFLLPCLPCAV